MRFRKKYKNVEPTPEQVMLESEGAAKLIRMREQWERESKSGSTNMNFYIWLGVQNYISLSLVARLLEKETEMLNLIL